MYNPNLEKVGKLLKIQIKQNVKTCESIKPVFYSQQNIVNELSFETMKLYLLKKKSNSEFRSINTSQKLWQGHV